MRQLDLICNNSVQSRILRLPDVKKMTGLSRSSVYLHIQKGTFPKPVRLGRNSVGWVEQEVTIWIRQLISQSRPLV